MYELLIAKRHLGSFSMSVEELRAWLGIIRKRVRMNLFGLLPN